MEEAAPLPVEQAQVNVELRAVVAGVQDAAPEDLGP